MAELKDIAWWVDKLKSFVGDWEDPIVFKLGEERLTFDSAELLSIPVVTDDPDEWPEKDSLLEVKLRSIRGLEDRRFVVVMALTPIEVDRILIAASHDFRLASVASKLNDALKSARKERRSRR